MPLPPYRDWRKGLGVLALIGACLIGLLAGAGCGSVAKPQSAVVHGEPQSIFEDELHLHLDPGGTLGLLRGLGVNRVRVYVAWRSLAPDPSTHHRPPGFNAADPGAYPQSAWAIYDTIVREAAKRGMSLDLTVGGPAPLWATGAGAPANPFASWKPSAAEFGRFVQAITKRYDGSYSVAGTATPLPRVTFWSLWNEPNYGVDLAPQATNHSTVEVSPRLYRDLVDAAWSALHATGHGSDTILIGETAPRGITTGDSPGNFSGMVPLRFIRALYCVDGSFRRLTGAAAAARGCPVDASAAQQFPRRHPALFLASGFADHPYAQGGMPPNVRTPGEPDYADLAALPNLESTLDRAVAAYGSRIRLPIYSTEFGYQTNPPETIAHTTDPVTAGYYLNWAEYISWRDPRMRSYDQYLLTDPPGASAAGGFATGLEFANRVPKATYGAYRMPLYLPRATASANQPIELWGCARPAPYVERDTGVKQRVEIQFQAGAHAVFKTLRSVPVDGPRCYLDVSIGFPSSGSVRLAWKYPHGPTIYSRGARVVIR